MEGPAFLPYLVGWALGSCLGSFFNVAVWRIPRGESVVSPGSRCPHCLRSIPWYRNLPVLTWLMQAGRCAWCRTPIPVFYVMVEICGGLVGIAGAWMLHGLGWSPAHAAGWTIFAWFSLPIALIDWEHFEIPDGLVASAMGLGLLAQTALEGIARGLDSLEHGLLAAGGLYAIHFLSRVGLGAWGNLTRALLPAGIHWSWRRGWKRSWLEVAGRWARFHPDMEALGLGDVTLGLAAGICLEAPAVLLGLAPAAFLGVFGYFWRHRHPRAQERAKELGVDSQAIPFGPFLSAGFLLAAFALRSGLVLIPR